MPRSWGPPFTVTVVSLSGESRTFYPMAKHYSMKRLVDWVEEEMVPQCHLFKLVLGDMVIDPYDVRSQDVRPPHYTDNWPEWDGYFTPDLRFPRKELRHYGIYQDTTLSLVTWDPRRSPSEESE